MAHGVIHWEIGGKDLPKLAEFYHELFGWETAGFDENYRLITPAEGTGGGLMRTREGMPPYVTIYVEADDLQGTLDHAVQLGGRALVQPQEIPGVGSFALFLDPEGNAIGVMSLVTKQLIGEPAHPAEAKRGQS